MLYVSFYTELGIYETKEAVVEGNLGREFT